MMRCLFLAIGVALLTGCAINPSTQLSISNDSRVNALSSINKQLVASQGNSIEQTTFKGCLVAKQYKGTHTFAKYLSNGKDGTPSPAAITINSDNLSSYVSSLWQSSKQNRDEMLKLLALHQGQDRACFEQEVLTLKDNKQTSNRGLTVEDYEQSRKILVKIYDYLKATLSASDYSELDEKIARDHIPVRVLLPTT